MRKPQTALVIAGLALALIAAAPAAASTPNTVLKSQLRVQKAKVAKLKTQLAKTKRDDASTITTLNGQIVTLTASFARAQTDLATRTTERDSANASLAAQTTLTSQAAAGAITGLSADQLWNLIVAIYPLMPNSGLCGLSKSYYASAPYFNYSFTSYVC